MRVASRLAVASSLWAAALIAVLLYNLTQVRGLAAGHRELADVDLRATTLALEQRRLLSQIDGFTRKLLVTRDPAYAERLDPLRGTFDDNLNEFAGLDLAAPLAVEVELMANRWRVLPLAELVETLLVEETSLNPLATTLDGERESRLMELFVEQSRALQDQTQTVFEATQENVREHAARSVADSERAVRVSWIVALIGLTLSLPFLWFTVRSIRRPLLRLQEGTRSVAGGKYTFKLGTEGTDEFAPVADSFNRMVERLGELDRAKRDFLSHVSHELKTPLAAMYETDSLLLEELPGRLTDKQRRLLELSLDNNRRLEVMISKLLDLAQLEEGALKYSTGNYELNGLLAEVVESYSALAWSRGVSLSVATVPPVEIACDRDRIVQVLANLTENAIRYAPSGSAVRIDVSTSPDKKALQRLPSKDFALVQIGDRGPGVPDDEKDKIFERFHQIRVEGRSSSGSVGLGLAIAREIVTDHGGAIWVSDRPGGGALFSLALPLAAELQAAKTG
ncbi:MAG: HAMP domain-containing histidine kinase [bacterium]|nr:HAMP domain-containing histidine kinase [bacterium]